VRVRFESFKGREPLVVAARRRAGGAELQQSTVDAALNRSRAARPAPPREIPSTSTIAPLAP
jgi:hypothetical protein